MVESIFAPSVGENVVYDYSDVATGRSMVLLYGAATTDSAGVNRILSGNTVRSVPTYIESETTFDVDFDITVNRYMKVEGDVVINFKWKQNGGGSPPATIYLVFKLRRYRGTTETQLGTVQSTSESHASDVYSHSVDMNITKNTLKKGDILRLTVEGYGGGGATKKVWLSHDPETAGDELKIWIPVMVQE